MDKKLVAKLIKEFEGCKLNAYKCPAGVWTIGIGHTTGVSEGDVITLSQADQFLDEDIDVVMRGVRSLIKVDLNGNQLAALISFAFNLGVYALSKSTLLRKLNAGDFTGAADEFGRWVYGFGSNKPLPGLIKRRKVERDLFLK